MAKHDVAPQGEGKGIHRACGFRCLFACVDADAAEIVAESWFEECPRGGIKRLAGRTQYVMHDGWNGGGISAACFPPLQKLFLLFAFFTSTTRGAGTAAGALPLQGSEMRGHEGPHGWGGGLHRDLFSHDH